MIGSEDEGDLSPDGGERRPFTWAVDIPAVGHQQCSWIRKALPRSAASGMRPRSLDSAPLHSFIPFHTEGTVPFGNFEWQAPQDLIILLIEPRINSLFLSRA